MSHYFHVADPWPRGFYNVKRWGMKPERRFATYYQNWQWFGSFPDFEDEFAKGPDRFNHDDFAAAFEDGFRFMPHLTKGIILIDFEAWPWTLKDPFTSPEKDDTRSNFVNERIAIADGDVDLAELRYTPFARAAGLLVLNITRRRYPKAWVGFYSGVYCGSNNPPDDKVRAANDAQRFILDASDVISPRCYAPADPDHDWWQNSVMAGHIEESNRLLRQSTGPGRAQTVAPTVSVMADGKWKDVLTEGQFANYMMQGYGANDLLHWGPGPRQDSKVRDTETIVQAYENYAGKYT